MNQFRYTPQYDSDEEFLMDFVFDVLDYMGFDDLSGFSFDLTTDLGSKVWFMDSDGLIYCIGYIHWTDDDDVFMEWEIFKQTTAGLVKMRKDS